MNHFSSKHDAAHDASIKTAYKALKSLTVAVSSNNNALAELQRLGNSTDSLNIKVQAEAYVKGQAVKANADWRTANNRAVAAEVNVLTFSTRLFSCHRHCAFSSHFVTVTITLPVLTTLALTVPSFTV